MKLQLALDRLNKKECMRIINETYTDIDILEIGTSVIKEFGMDFIREIKEEYPDVKLMADMKICDAGSYEAEIAFEAGADIVTVMGFSSSLTIKSVQKTSEEHKKSYVVDLLEIQDRTSISKLKNLGVDSVSLHLGKDKQTENGFDTEMFSLTEGFDFNVFVAGGIKIKNIEAISKHNPNVLIIGSEITSKLNPGEVVKKIQKEINKYR